MGVQSTRHEGVDLDQNDNAHVWRRYHFESAHQLPNVPQGHKCGRMHGHGFEVIIHASQGVTGRDISIDYDLLDTLWSPIFNQLNYKCLNDLPGLENPTSEMISSWIWGKLKSKLPELTWVTVYETASCGAHFDGTNYRIWKEMTIDSAVQLKFAPAEDRRHSIHGHTFTLRLHLNAPLDKVMGWTMDFGDLKELFNPIFSKIDHHPLFQNEQIVDTDCASIVQWIHKETKNKIPQIDRIDLFETNGSGVILSITDNVPALPV
jgi:6-pyruvoyltetrahydropterin/6-carboxytetrahydropterin synthase